MVKISGYKWNNQSAIAPINTGLVTIAQNTLENVISRANAQLENAMQVDGIQTLIFIRSLEGNACSCSGTSMQSQTKIDTNSTPIEEMSDNYSVVPIRGYEDGYTGNIGENQTASPDLYGEKINTVNQFEQLEFSPEELAMLSLDGVSLYPTDAVACGICFGTGRTQGYSLFNGQRINLAANDDYPYQLTNGVALDTNTRPTSFLLPNNTLGAVVWKIELPTYYQAVTSICIFNNREIAANIIAEYSPDEGTTWLPFTSQNLMAQQGVKKVWLIRARTLNKGDSSNRFTHITIHLENLNRCKGQTTNMDVSINMETVDAPVTQSWYFTSNISSLPRESVFYDYKYGYLWKVLSVQQSKTTNGQVFGYSIAARIVQMNEKYYPLKYSLTNSTNLAFYGLETFQGGINVYDNNQLNKLDDQVRSFNWNNHKFDQSFSGFPATASTDTSNTTLSPLYTVVSNGTLQLPNGTMTLDNQDSTPPLYPDVDEIITDQEIPDGNNAMTDGTIPKFNLEVSST